jgi:hypothetical protein
MRGNTGGADRPGSGDDGWSDAGHWADAEPWYSQDPQDSSCPPEFVGVPLNEIFAAADAAEVTAPAPPEAADAGYLHGVTPQSPRPALRPGPAAGFASQAPLDLALPGVALASFCEEATGDNGRCPGASDDELIGVLRAALRHLVEVRDGECSWPTCRRPARRCDFEHAQPWDQGGRTCACNAGPCCRRHHQAKQAEGWRLDQHQPGDHTWTTPSGRTYTTAPATYPV